MVYFYAKLIEEGKQLEISPKIKGENYKLKIPKEANYIIDFGFVMNRMQQSLRLPPGHSCHPGYRCGL